MTKFEIDKDLIRELAALLEETGLAEIEWEQDAQRIRVSRATLAAPAAAAPAPSETTRTAPVPLASPEPEPAPRTDSHPGAVTSPMVGTVYLSPQPGATRFVNLGDQVREGQTLFIIEAMKTMNPLLAPRAGTVAQILAADGAPVEYGEILLILE